MPERAATIGTEARALAALNHANVVGWDRELVRVLGGGKD